MVICPFRAVADKPTNLISLGHTAQAKVKRQRPGVNNKNFHSVAPTMMFHIFRCNA